MHQQLHDNNPIEAASIPSSLEALLPYPQLVRDSLNPHASLKDIEATSAKRLDWPSICAALADRCTSEGTKQLALELPLFGDKALIQHRQQEIWELAELIEAGDAPPSIAIDDIRDALRRASKQALLTPEALTAVAALAVAANTLHAYFRRRQEDIPELWKTVSHLRQLGELEQRLTGIFDADGQLADDASPNLGRLRTLKRRLHEQARGEIEQRLKAIELEVHLQDDFYTQREGRYVLPIKVGARGRVKGIVHATSASGQTVFVEPEDLVPLNNQLRMAEIDVQDEERRILERLSNMVAEHQEALEINFALVRYLDLSLAGARLSHDLGASIPELGGEEISLYEARHPVLVLRYQAQGSKNEVVSNRIELGGAQPTLVISGANAGGKTVNLKTIGLFALMIRAGLPISAHHGSRFPIFTQVVTDIGDEQSIADDTSTFSSHILNLVRFFPAVKEGSLVLLDEPFAGTDPDHAAALSIALLEELHQAKAMAVITTHLDRVKAFALEQDWLANASVGFDLEALKPTFKLHLGSPGGSSALRIAARLGLPDAIIERARILRQGDPNADLEQVLQNLEAERARIAMARQRWERAQTQLAKRKEALEQEIEKVRKGEFDLLSKKVREAERKLRAALDALDVQHQAIKAEEGQKNKEELRKQRKALRQEEANLREARRTITEESKPDLVDLLAKDLKPGMTVWSKTYQRSCQIVDITPKGGVTLQLGILQMTVDASDLAHEVKRPPQAKGKKKRDKKKGQGERRPRKEIQALEPDPVATAAPSQRPLVPQSPQNTVDLRGMRVDEATERLDLFLDDATRRDQATVYVIHGHGTGVLKREMRRFLNQSNYVEAFRPGERREGGDGVTLAWLRAF